MPAFPRTNTRRSDRISQDRDTGAVDVQARPERWSIAEIVEHVIAVQERVIGIIRQQLVSALPPPPEQDREVVDSIVIHQIPSRLSKFRTPDIPPQSLANSTYLRT